MNHLAQTQAAYFRECCHPVELANPLRRALGMRNILVHGCLRIALVWFAR